MNNEQIDKEIRELEKDIQKMYRLSKRLQKSREYIQRKEANLRDMIMNNHNRINLLIDLQIINN